MKREERFAFAVEMAAATLPSVTGIYAKGIENEVAAEMTRRIGVAYLAVGNAWHEITKEDPLPGVRSAPGRATTD